METSFGSYCYTRCNNRFELGTYAERQTAAEDAARRAGKQVVAGQIKCPGTLTAKHDDTVCGASELETAIAEPGEKVPPESERYVPTHRLAGRIPGFVIVQKEGRL